MTTEPPSTPTTETSTSPATTSDTTASSSSGACGVGRGDFNKRLVEVALRRSLFIVLNHAGISRKKGLGLGKTMKHT